MLDDAVIDDEDYLLLYQLEQDRELHQNGIFTIEYLSDEDCKLMFRFKKEDIYRLVGALEMPDIILANRARASGLESLCLVLRRLAYPNRLYDLVPVFSRDETYLSKFFNEALEFINGRFMHLLTSLNQPWLVNELEAFTESVYEKCGVLPSCWGFIDGTLRPCCRPVYNQQVMFNGHKRVHGLKFQGVMLPNGIIGSLHGPFEGKRHDAFILNETDITTHIRNFHKINGDPVYLYGDPAYPLMPCLMTPFRGDNLLQEQQMFNTQMSRVRQCVEWGFGKVSRIFAFVDFKKNLKLFLQPVGMYYTVATLLSNCHTCLYGSQTSTYFGLEPPQLEDYLQ